MQESLFSVYSLWNGVSVLGASYWMKWYFHLPLTPVVRILFWCCSVYHCNLPCVSSHCPSLTITSGVISKAVKYTRYQFFHIARFYILCNFSYSGCSFSIFGIALSWHCHISKLCAALNNFPNIFIRDRDTYTTTETVYLKVHLVDLFGAY